MKTTGHLILYISETEDYELWRILVQISPEERTTFIKKALKKAVATQTASPSPVEKNIPVHLNTEANHLTAAAAEPEDEQSDQLRFDELFLSSVLPDKKDLPGLDFLLHNVIGEEDDEMVIEFFRNRTSRN